MTNRQHAASIWLLARILGLTFAISVCTAERCYAVPLLSFQGITVEILGGGTTNTGGDDSFFTIVEFNSSGDLIIRSISHNEWGQLSPVEQDSAVASHFDIDFGPAQRISIREKEAFGVKFGMFSNAATFGAGIDATDLRFTIRGQYVLTENAKVYYDVFRHEFINFVFTENTSPLTDRATAQAFGDYDVAPFGPERIFHPQGETLELVDAFDQKGTNTYRPEGPEHQEMPVKAGPHDFKMEIYTRAEALGTGIAFSSLRLAGFSLGVVPLLVPEPGTLALLIAGLVTLVRSRSNRRHSSTRRS